MAVQTIHETQVIIEGYVYDTVSGECIGPAEIPAKFAVVDESSANWVLGKMQDEECAIQAALTTPEVIKARAILANAMEIADRHRGYLHGWHFRFDEELKQFALADLKRKKAKGRTWQSIHGKIKLRWEESKVKVAEGREAAAIAWAKLRGLNDCVHQPEEEFRISGVPTDVMAAIKLTYTMPEAPRQEHFEDQKAYRDAYEKWEIEFAEWEGERDRAKEALGGYDSVFKFKAGHDTVKVELLPSGKDVRRDAELLKI